MIRFIGISTRSSKKLALSVVRSLAQFGDSSPYARMIARRLGAQSSARRLSVTARFAALSLGQSIISRFAFTRTLAKLSDKELAEKSPGKQFQKLVRLKAYLPIISKLATSFGQSLAKNADALIERLRAPITTTMSRLAFAGFAGLATFDGTRQNPRTPPFGSSYNLARWEKFTGQKAELLTRQEVVNG